jgi:hypothetical protein
MTRRYSAWQKDRHIFRREGGGRAKYQTCGQEGRQIEEQTENQESRQREGHSFQQQNSEKFKRAGTATDEQTIRQRGSQCYSQAGKK